MSEHFHPIRANLVSGLNQSEIRIYVNNVAAMGYKIHKMGTYVSQSF